VSAKALTMLYPLPNLPGTSSGANNLIGAKPNQQTTDQFSVRGDYNPNSANGFYARFIYFNPRKLVGQNAALPNFADNQNTPTHNVAIGYTRTITPKIVNQFRIGYLRFTQILGDVQIDVPINQQIGITGTSTQFLGNPNIAITGFPHTGAITNAPNNRRDNGYYIYDDVLLQRGRHGLSVGAMGGAEQFNGGQNPNARGNFSFTNQYTQQIGQSTTGFALADFLLGYPATSARGLGSGFRNWRQGKYALYVQDDWKVRSDLTVNLGVRYEYTQPQYEAHNNVTGFLNGQVVQLGTNGVPRGLRNPYRKDFEPRVGVAYRPGGGSTVIRSGYGITFVPLLFLTPAFAMSNNPPLFAAQSYVGTSPVPNLTLANAFPANLGTTSTTVSTVSPNFRDAYIQQWNLMVEHELPKRVTLEFGFVGNKGTRLSYTQNINASPAGPGNVQAKRPYPNFSSISSLGSFATSNYNSMVVKTQRSFSSGVTFLATYTWAKSLSAPSQSLVGDGASSTSVRDPLNPKADRGRDVFDIRHRVTGSAVWDLPFGHGHKFGGNWPRYLEYPLGGWRGNLILNLMSGYPFTPALGLDNANTGDSSQDRPDVIGDPNKGPHTVQHWFNTAAFTLPAKYSYGSAGTNIITGPPQRTLDVSVQKRWPLPEKASLLFRTDIFNIANTPQFDTPGATYGTSTFGVISSAGDPRVIQFAARIEF
jgi:outer membrane receptor protein involved in Fe transport